MLIPAVTLRTAKLDLANIAELRQLAIDHPSALLMYREDNKVLVAFCVVCMFMVSTEIMCCLLANVCIYRGRFLGDVGFLLEMGNFSKRSKF